MVKVPVKPGMARLFGLKRPTTIPLARISNVPGGDLLVVTGTANMRSWMATAAGTAVHEAPVVIHSGMVSMTNGTWVSKPRIG